MKRDAAGGSTPLMQQYREIKARHADAIVFFRMGDFYEMFFDDAEVASRELGLTLTSRNNGGAADVPLAGVPVKAAAEYLRRLVARGHRVAICEQVEDPRLAKGVVKHHRTLGTTLNALVAAGFVIRHVEEWRPSEAQLAEHPEWQIELNRPMFLLIACERP